MSDDNDIGAVYDRITRYGEVIRSFRRDGWLNVLTGLGTSSDKTKAGCFAPGVRISDKELSALYHHYDLAKRIVNIVPQECFREGFSIDIDDDTETGKAVNQYVRDKNVLSLFMEGEIWGRLYGGCLLIAGIDDGKDMSEPLDDEAPIHSVRYMLLLDKRFIFPAQWYEDPASPKYLEPEIYQIVTPTGESLSEIHESRCIRFRGAMTDPIEQRQLGGWDYSVLQAIYDAIRSAEENWNVANIMMADASQGVLKIKGLIAALATPKGEENVRTRLSLFDMAKSVARSVLLDADYDESYQRISTSFASVPEMLDRSMMRTSAAAEIPVTILFGRSAAGMNATGDADFRGFYDRLSAYRKYGITPRLTRLLTWLMRAEDGPTGGIVPEDWEICFPRLWQPTPAEQAAINKTIADTDKVYIDAGVYLPEEVALSRARGGPEAAVEIDEDMRETLLEHEKEMAQNPPPPVVPPALASGIGGDPNALPGQGGTPNIPSGDPGGDQSQIERGSGAGS